MATFEEFMDVTQSIANEYKMTIEQIHNHVLSLKMATNQVEVARTIYIEADQSIGISFQIELINTDAIQIFSACRHFYPEIKLLECFYMNATGEVFNGVDAQVMMEHDRENRYLKILEKRVRAEQEDEFQTKLLEKSGKVTFH